MRTTNKMCPLAFLYPIKGQIVSKKLNLTFKRGGHLGFMWVEIESHTVEIDCRFEVFGVHVAADLF